MSKSVAVLSILITLCVAGCGTKQDSGQSPAETRNLASTLENGFQPAPNLVGSWKSQTTWYQFNADGTGRWGVFLNGKFMASNPITWSMDDKRKVQIKSLTETRTLLARMKGDHLILDSGGQIDNDFMDEYISTQIP